MGKERIKRDNYITIQGFMVTDLQLKGNELIIYACIYGFSQTEGQTFAGNLSYLAEWTNSTKQGIIKNLKSLEERGYVLKRENYINGVKFCEYCVTELNGIKQSLMGVNSVEQGGKKSLTNNIIDNIKETTPKGVGKKSFNPPTYDQVLEYAQSRGREDLAKKFYDYYTEGCWISQDGKPVKNWKQKFITWDQHNNSRIEQHSSQHTENERNYTKEFYDSLITDIDEWDI